MDKAGSYSETTGGQGGGGYNQEDKYEKEKRVRAKNTAPRYKIQRCAYFEVSPYCHKRELSLSELHERDGYNEEASPSESGEDVRHLCRQASLLHYSGNHQIFAGNNIPFS